MEKRNVWITTFTGGRFYPFNPSPESIKIVDIIHALSMIVRFAGHCKEFYSVAQHCINCAREAQYLGFPPKIQLYCLLHDAAETYLQDLPKPIKEMFPEYKEAEIAIMNTIWEACDLPKPTDEEWNIVKGIDEVMLCNEACILMDTTNWDMGEFPEIQNAKFRIAYRPMDSIRDEFYSIFQEIVGYNK